MSASAETGAVGGTSATNSGTNSNDFPQPPDETTVHAEAAVVQPTSMLLPGPEAAVPFVRFSLSAASGTAVDTRIEILDASEMADALRPSSSPLALLPPPYTVGEKLYFIGESETLDDGNRLVHGEQGTLIAQGMFCGSVSRTRRRPSRASSTS